PHVLEGSHPRVEDRPDRRIPRMEKAPDLARTGVQIEIHREFVVFGLCGGGVSIRAPHPVPIILLYIGVRAQRPLFLAGPEGDANGAAWLEAERFENAHGLPYHRPSGGSSGRTVSAGPRV